MKAILFSSENGCYDYDIEDLPKVHRVRMNQKLEKGEPMNVYCSGGIKLGCTWDGNLESSLKKFSVGNPHYLELLKEPQASMPKVESSVTAPAKMNFLQGQAVMVLVAESMGLAPSMIDDAKKILANKTVHPMIGAALEKEAVSANNRIRHDANLIAKANAYSEEIKKQYSLI